MKLSRIIYFNIILGLGIASCKKDQLITSESAKLKFSVDTLMFDTVFTTIGSNTRSFMVYNTHSERIKISSVTLAKGKASEFRVNVNGIADEMVEDVEIPAKDSIYIFVEVTVDPVNDQLPMVVNDSLVFYTNGNRQDVKLVAWGQDVHLMRDTILDSQTWTADKPYLVYGNYPIFGLYVDEGDTLTIEKGVNVHFHKGSQLTVAGTLIVKGTEDEPVVFQGDRLEEDYDDIPGQWNAIALVSNNHHYFDHAIIKNGIVGVQAGLYPDIDLRPKVTFNNSIIENMSFAGMYVFGAEVTGMNSIFADCGNWCLGIFRGGNYEFYHCTFDNRWSGFTNRSEPAVAMTNYFEDDTSVVVQDLDKALFGNCIVHGFVGTEIGYIDVNDVPGLAGLPEAKLDFLFDNCLVKVKDDDEDVDITDETRFVNVINEPGFKTSREDDKKYYLDTLSVAKDAGDMKFINQFPELEHDKKNDSRLLDEGPDLGAYERVE